MRYCTHKLRIEKSSCGGGGERILKLLVTDKTTVKVTKTHIFIKGLRQSSNNQQLNGFSLQSHIQIGTLEHQGINKELRKLKYSCYSVSIQL